MTLDRRDYKTSIPQLEARLSAIEKVGDKSLTNFDVLQDLLEKEIAERQRLYLKQDTSINTITVKMYYVIKDYGVTPTTDDVGWAETMPKMDYSNDDKVLWYMSKTFRNGAVIETSTPQQVQLMDGVFAFINSVADADNNWTTIDGGKISTGRIQDNINGDNYFDLDSGEFNFQDSNGNYVRQNGNGIQIQGTLSLSSAVGSGTLNDIVEDMADFAQDVIDINGDIQDLQDQIDRNITTWFYAYEPTLNDPPVTAEQGVSGTGWDTDEKKNNHLGDLFYDTTTGYAYRFMKENNTYSWAKITDSDVTEALRLAGEAQDTADHKRRVFVTTPTPPYDVGDLWAEGSSGDIKKCKTAKVDGQSYSASDWELASKYTDDTVATNALGVANGADFRTQYIYISKVSGTNTVSANTTWVSDATGNQNTWTTKRPQYSSSYPVLFIAKQSQTMAQSGGSTCSCTTPVKDDTTTVIDGGHITTGTIDASVVNVTNISASSITVGQIQQSQVQDLTTDLSNRPTTTDMNTAIDDAKQIKTDTASGSVATFTGSEYPAVKLTSTIKSGKSFDGVSINVCGKNLIKDERYVSSANAVYIGTSTTAQHYYPVGTTLTLSCSFLNGVHYGAYMRYESDTSNRTIWSPTSATTSATITIAKDEKFSLWFYIGSGLTSSNITNLQLELGSTKTTYGAYKGTTYTTDLGQTVSSGGSLDVLKGILTISGTDYRCAPQNIAFSQGTNNVWSTSGDVSVTYAIISADAVEALNNPIDGASKVATSYITQIDNGGIKVHDAGDTKNYSKIDSNGMKVYQNNNKVASFGASSRIGREEINNFKVTPTSIGLFYSSDRLFDVEYDADDGNIEMFFADSTILHPSPAEGCKYTNAQADAILSFIQNDCYADISSLKIKRSSDSSNTGYTLRYSTSDLYDVLDSSGDEITCGNYGGILYSSTGNFFEPDYYLYPLEEKGTAVNLNACDGTGSFNFIADKIETNGDSLIKFAVYDSGLVTMAASNVTTVNVTIKPPSGYTGYIVRCIVQNGSGGSGESLCNPYSYYYYNSTTLRANVRNMGTAQAKVHVYFTVLWVNKSLL